jgi:predicted transcriptional regulator
MRYRTREEIFAAILTSTGSGRPMTLNKIVFYCYLPHSAAVKSTAILVQKGLLEFDRLDRIFRTTDKGFKYLELHNEMNKVFEFEEPLRVKTLAL